MSVNDVYDIFKSTVMEVADEVRGVERERGKEKGNALWRNEIKDALEGKKRVYKKMVQRNLTKGSES